MLHIPRADNGARGGLLLRAGGQQEAAGGLGLLLADLDEHPVAHGLHCLELQLCQAGVRFPLAAGPAGRRRRAEPLGTSAGIAVAALTTVLALLNAGRAGRIWAPATLRELWDAKVAIVLIGGTVAVRLLAMEAAAGQLKPPRARECTSEYSRSIVRALGFGRPLRAVNGRASLLGTLHDPPHAARAGNERQRAPLGSRSIGWSPARALRSPLRRAPGCSAKGR